jgi:hypothetical protein
LVLDGPMNATTFVTYLKECLVPELKRGDVVMMDNLPVHRVAAVREVIEAAGATLRYLPKYSPEGSKTPLGNLLDGSFARRMKPAPCDSRHCYYFCNKHVVRRPGEPTLRLPQRKTVPATVRVRRAIARRAIRGLLAVWPFSV